MIKSLNVATVFSGIGSFEQALILEGIQHSILFACDNGERELPADAEKHISEMAHDKGLDAANREAKKAYSGLRQPNYVKRTYFENYEISEDRWFDDIRFIDGKRYFDKIDIFVGGSPCQSFSMMGKRKGLEDTRGTLFYEYARIISEAQPKVFVYENVPGMLNHNHGDTWATIKTVFEGLGYHLSISIVNAADYGLPQNRKRLFVIGLKEAHSFEFEPPLKLTKTANDFLESNIPTRFYLGEKGFKFVTNPKYFGRARINQDVIRTQKANQQFNWNGDFRFEPLSSLSPEEKTRILSRAYVGEWNGVKGVCRQLTHRECFRLMGYPDSFKIVVPSVQAYRQAGNSIAVNVMQMIIRSIIATGAFE
ncbi:MAG: DNA cytosine methyltransferase [Bacilli bacterium]|nr:DNA cytosine methyltransferase [Bacilli bacterium]